MDSDDRPTFEQRPPKPKAPLAPMTEWRTPGADTRSVLPGAVKPPRTGLLVGGALALVAVVAVAATLLSRPDISDLVAATPVVERSPDRPRQRGPSSYPPIELPSGLVIDRSVLLNYDLAAWLATEPAAPRTFVFDRLGFDPGSAALREDDRPALQVLLQILTAYPQAKATIIGNGPGSLGSERAAAIRDALLQLAADPDQLAIAAGDGSESAPRLSVKLDLGVASDLDA